MFKAFRYRLYPNAEQSESLAKHFGCCRWVFNRALAKKMEAWPNVAYRAASKAATTGKNNAGLWPFATS
ncbi:MAG: helix-turn-helix domain-containing protein [Verrucomicrobia bacterium]|nr:helix-turn-helix domain-containing protein [Verrucomicrobiota bacterium]